MMMRDWSSASLYVAGRVTALLTIILIIAAVVTSAVALSKMHPPRSIQHHAPKNS